MASLLIVSAQGHSLLLSYKQLGFQSASHAVAAHAVITERTVCA